MTSKNTMKVAVTGASGLLGRVVIKELKASTNFDVIGLGFLRYCLVLQIYTLQAFFYDYVSQGICKMNMTDC